MITHITVEDAAKLISRLTNANKMQALTYIREAADRGEIQAATALSTLQAENSQLRAYLEYEREHADAYYEECGQWEAENEKLRAELERVKNERDSVKATLHWLKLHGQKEG